MKINLDQRWRKMKVKKEFYLMPQAETVNLVTLGQILSGSDGVDSNTESLDILDDDFSNWGGF